MLADDPMLDRLFRQASARIEQLLPLCPSRNDLIHGDLLHRNVLITPDSSRVTAVFSWKCSVIGDFLYDTAWCTFWSPWYPGIAATDPWSMSCADTPAKDLANAAERHHCYELVIGAGHLGWNAWTQDAVNLKRTAERTQQILDRGPLSPLRHVTGPKARG
jgi:aminoglycoside phosphotransferase (APT) family kinase protein